MKIRVLINGALGKMGSMAVQAVQDDPNLELCGTSDKEDNLRLQIEKCKPQVVVDLTTASTAFETAKLIIDCSVHPVIGTSGLQKKDVITLQEVCRAKNLGGVIAPNFSISAVLMMKYAQDAIKYLPDAEIVEMHHDGKEDSPSGTAIRTAEMMAESRKESKVLKSGKEILSHARGAELSGIPIHSVRLQGLLAHQEVIFGGAGQTLLIRSDTFTRESFMPGICLACKKVTGLKELFYGLEHLL